VTVADGVGEAGAVEEDGVAGEDGAVGAVQGIGCGVGATVLKRGVCTGSSESCCQVVLMKYCL